MQFRFSEQTKQLSVKIINELMPEAVADFWNTISRLEVVAVTVDVASARHLNLVGLRFLAELKLYTEQTASDFIFSKQSTDAVKDAFKCAILNASMYDSERVYLRVTSEPTAQMQHMV